MTEVLPVFAQTNCQPFPSHLLSRRSVFGCLVDRQEGVGLADAVGGLLLGLGIGYLLRRGVAEVQPRIFVTVVLTTGIVEAYVDLKRRLIRDKLCDPESAAAKARMPSSVRPQPSGLP